MDYSGVSLKLLGAIVLSNYVISVCFCCLIKLVWNSLKHISSRRFFILFFESGKIFCAICCEFSASDSRNMFFNN